MLAIIGFAFILAAGCRPPRTERPEWTWPLAGFRLERAYGAPAHEYGAGHRGIDLRPLAGTDVLAPDGGTVAFTGLVAERGILTIDHGGGLVTTFEPVRSSLEPGTVVARGDVVGVVDRAATPPSAPCTSAYGSTASTSIRCCFSVECRARCSCRCGCCSGPQARGCASR